MEDGNQLVKISTHIIEDLNLIKLQLGADTDGLKQVQCQLLSCLLSALGIFCPYLHGWQANPMS